MDQNLIYLKDSYIKECDAKVDSVNNSRYIILDNVIFYPNSGGQPYDTGKIIRVKDNVEFDVVYSTKLDGLVSIEVNKEGLAEGDIVKCVLDWERRYTLMRMHTAAHILANVFYRKGGIKITGNQLGIDRSRFDFSMDSFDRDKIVEYVKEANETIRKGIDVKVYELPYEEAMKISGIVKLSGAFPPNLKMLRIVEIPDVDIQADGGTHVRNTSEIGTIEIVALENKGKSNKRVYFTLK
ncbi:MAG: alanine--tRNA ligase-related protein [Candidatus Micrarchaeia archaeon]